MSKPIKFITKTPEEMDVVMKKMATMLKEEDLRRKYLGDEYDWYMEHKDEFLTNVEDATLVGNTYVPND